MSKRFLQCTFALLVVLATGTTLCYAKAAAGDSTNTRQKNSATRLLYFHYVDDIYKTAALGNAGVDSAVFQDAVTGYYNLKISNLIPVTSSVLTVIDYNKPAIAKRMWVVDLQSKKLLLSTFVSANKSPQGQGSIGFYITANVYQSKNGQAIALDGMDEGFNTNAFANEFALTGTENAGQQISAGNCPVINADALAQAASLIKSKNVLFINRKNSEYSSRYLDEARAAKYAFADSSFNLVKDVFGN